jgi:tRNA dimethylallyltransferase
VICGPTASGKSALALRLSELFGASIISADSRQIYRDFDIGTAKPSAAEQSRARHYCIDLVDARVAGRFSAADWAREAEKALHDCAMRGSPPVIVGGTGFYLRALFDPLFQEPELDENVLSSLRAHMRDLPTEELRRWCKELDPALSHADRAQLLRAIEVSTLAGERLSDLRRTNATTPRHAARYLLVDSGPLLPASIEKRVHEMFEAGWEAEVSRLNADVPASAPAWKSTGYREVQRLVLGETTREGAASRIVTLTRQYAKRQRTWFRHQLRADGGVREGRGGRGAEVTRMETGGQDSDVFARAVRWWMADEAEGR